MPVAAALQILLALNLSRRVILPLLGIDPTSDAGRELSLCTTLHNPGVLPLLFFDALFGSPYPDLSVLPQMAAYLSFYLMGFSPLFWAIGPSIMKDGKYKDTANSHLSHQPPLLDRLRQGAVKFVKPPPVRAALTGLIIATTPCLRALLIGEAAPLRQVFVALENFSRAYLPSASLVLAGSLVSGAQTQGKERARESKREAEASKVAAAAQKASAAVISPTDEEAAQAARVVADSLTAAASDPGYKRRIAAIAITRFCVLPAVGFGVLRGLAAASLFPAPHAAPTLWFFLLTQFAMPPAQNQIVMLQVLGMQENAARVARTLLVTYTISTVPLTVLFSAFKVITGL